MSRVLNSAISRFLGKIAKSVETTKSRNLIPAIFFSFFFDIGSAGLPSLDPFHEVDQLMRDQLELFQYDMVALLSINNDCLEVTCTLFEKAMVENGEIQTMIEMNEFL